MMLFKITALFSWELQSVGEDLVGSAPNATLVPVSHSGSNPFLIGSYGTGLLVERILSAGSKVPMGLRIQT